MGPRPGRGRQSSPRGSGKPPPLLRRRPRPRSRILPRHSVLATERPKEEEEGGGTPLRPLGRFGFRRQQNNGLGCLLGIYRFNLNSGKVTGAPGVASLDVYIVYRRLRRWHSSVRPFATSGAQGQTEAEPSALLSSSKVQDFFIFLEWVGGTCFRGRVCLHRNTAAPLGGRGLFTARRAQALQTQNKTVRRLNR